MWLKLKALARGVKDLGLRDLGRLDLQATGLPEEVAAGSRLDPQQTAPASVFSDVWHH